MKAKSTSCRRWKADSRQEPAFPIATIELESGGRIGVCPLPGRHSDLVDDLDAVLAWAQMSAP